MLHNSTKHYRTSQNVTTYYKTHYKILQSITKHCKKYKQTPHIRIILRNIISDYNTLRTYYKRWNKSTNYFKGLQTIATYCKISETITNYDANDCKILQRLVWQHWTEDWVASWKTEASIPSQLQTCAAPPLRHRMDTALRLPLWGSGSPLPPKLETLGTTKESWEFVSTMWITLQPTGTYLLYNSGTFTYLYN